MVKPNWFVSERGRDVVAVAFGSLGTLSFFAYYAPNAIFMDKYRDVIRLYRNGYSVPVPPQIKSRFDKALNLLEVPDNEKKFLRPFMATGFDLVGIGSTNTTYGALIGIPANFEFQEPSSVDKFKIKLKQESILWESQAGTQLLNSLILSENAQIYAMAREMRLRQSIKFPTEGCIGTFCFLSFGIISRHINKQLNLYTKPRALRLLMYGMVSFLNLGLFWLLKDSIQLYSEEQIDIELKKKSPIFAEGGREFYTKILQRNIALRELLGKEGERTFTALGNENHLIRTKHLPIVERKEFFEANM